MKKSILLLLFPFLVFSQVGINTQTFLPGEMFRVATGTVTYENIPLVTTSEFVMVTDSDGKQKKMLLSSLTTNSGQCPNFLKSQSSGYHIKFSSPASVPNPNNALDIQGKNFTPAGSSINNNTYFYSWSNTTGQPINIDNMSVNFSGLICNYQ